MDEVRVYTLAELAEILHVTRRTLYRYVSEGKLKAVKMGGGWRVTQDQLQSFFDANTKGGTK